eukprot:2524586-Karenia_brevis.AAC.1
MAACAVVRRDAQRKFVASRDAGWCVQVSRDQAGWHRWCHQFQRSHLSSFKARWAAMAAVETGFGTSMK